MDTEIAQSLDHVQYAFSIIYSQCLMTNTVDDKAIEDFEVAFKKLKITLGKQNAEH